MAPKILIQIEVVSDVMCPWCFIAKRKMEIAMETVRDKYDFRVKWLPFLLYPDLPKEGVPLSSMTHLTPQYLNRMTQTGKAVGINFDFKKCRVPNTLQAHSLLEYAGEVDSGTKQDAMVETIFKAFFEEGRYPADDTLLDIGEKYGLDRATSQSVITDQTRLIEVRNKARSYSQRGISGVPCFYMNGKKIFSGAQEPSAFVNMFQLVAEQDK